MTVATTLLGVGFGWWLAAHVRSRTRSLKRIAEALDVVATATVLARAREDAVDAELAAMNTTTRREGEGRG